MNYIETALIYILTAWTIYLTIILYRFKQTKIRIETMASNWAQYMGEKSGQVRQGKAQSKHLASGQTKILDTIASQVPGAASILKTSGVSDDEAWALITDPNTMKGIKVIMETLGGVTKFIEKAGDKTGKKKSSRKGTGSVPLLPYKHAT